MRKVLGLAAATALIFSSSVMAEFDQSKVSVGGSYGLGNNGVLSVRGDYDISDKTDKPVVVRVGYDRYTINTLGLSEYSWSYNVFYAGAYYYFNDEIDLGDKIKPFAGLGFGLGSASCSGSLCNNFSTPTVGGFYYIAGVQYDVNDKISAELGFSGWTGLSLGANYKF